MEIMRTETHMVFINTDTQEKQEFNWGLDEHPQFTIEVMYRHGTPAYNFCKHRGYNPVDRIDLESAGDVEKFFNGEDVYDELADNYFQYEPDKYIVTNVTIW